MSTEDLTEIEQFLAFKQNEGTITRFVTDTSKAHRIVNTVTELVNFAKKKGYRVPVYLNSQRERPYYVLLHVAHNRILFLEILMDFKHKNK